jgi:hypothetical protein
VASYIKERTKNAQFIVISLRNNMFELAERLVGIYKVNHMTKSVTVENRAAEGELCLRESRLECGHGHCWLSDYDIHSCVTNARGLAK